MGSLGNTALAPLSEEAVNTLDEQLPLTLTCSTCGICLRLSVQRGFQCPGGLLVLDIEFACPRCGLTGVVRYDEGSDGLLFDRN